MFLTTKYFVAELKSPLYSCSMLIKSNERNEDIDAFRYKYNSLFEFN